MKKLIVLFMLIIVMCGDLFAQTTPPSAYTTYYRLRMWSQGARASADSLNQNWKDIDAILYNLIVNVDPRYFAWKDANHDTLTLNNLVFGTLSFGDGENFYLPYHDPPFTNLAIGAIGYTTGGWLTMRNSSRVDTMMSLYQYRFYRDGGETSAGNKVYNGTATFNNTSTFNVAPNLYTWKTLWVHQRSVPADTVNGLSYPTTYDSVRYFVKGIANTLDTTGVVFSGNFMKTPSDIQFRFMSRIFFNGGYSTDYDSVKCLIKIDARDTDGLPFVGSNPVYTAVAITGNGIQSKTYTFPSTPTTGYVMWEIRFITHLKTGKVPSATFFNVFSPMVDIRTKVETW